MTTSPFHHTHHLSVEIGARPVGSPANRAAENYIAGFLGGLGYTVERQEYDCIAWEAKETRLYAGDTPLAAEANPYSPPCDLRAPLLPVSTLAELQAADIGRRILLFSGDLAKEPISPRDWFLQSERDKQVYDRLEATPPAAILAVSSGPGELPRLIEDDDLDIPSATVPAQVGLALLKSPPEMLRLSIDSARGLGRTANVVARRPGQGRGKLVICAHYDTKIDTPGAHDNASGAAVLLALAERLYGRAFSYDLEFVAFTGEEYLPIGDEEYLRRGEHEFGQILAAVNFDGAGLALGSTSIAHFSASEAFVEKVQEVVRSYPGVVWTDPWPQSNHSTFAWRGVPSLAFTSAGGGALAHTRADTIDVISAGKLDELVELVEAIARELDGKTVEWTRPPSENP
jgi:aminopeptidase YwaD